MKERTNTRNLRLVTLNLDWDDVREYKEQLHTDLSKAIRQLIREQLDESKKVEALQGLPILNTQTPRQTTISEYDIKLFQPSEERMQNIKTLSNEQRTKLAIDVVHLQNQIRAVRK
jgi:hypothetical protein